MNKTLYLVAISTLFIGSSYATASPVPSVEIVTKRAIHVPGIERLRGHGYTVTVHVLDAANIPINRGLKLSANADQAASQALEHINAHAPSMADDYATIWRGHLLVHQHQIKSLPAVLIDGVLQPYRDPVAAVRAWFRSQGVQHD